MMLAIAMGLPSRYAIGQEVYFHPNMFKITPLNLRLAFIARIEKVQFSGSKVTYDLALLVEEGDADGNMNTRFYDVIPVKDVDSTFVSSYQDICTEHARTLRIQTEEEIRQNPELYRKGYSLEEKLARLKDRRQGTCSVEEAKEIAEPTKGGVGSLLTEQEVRERAAIRFYDGLETLRIRYKEETDANPGIVVG